jgi:hypothetical protein|tara:strand:+ start:1089 stop:1295 length:207 start_codon:yes stop_codon:yes gene_type:complete
MNKKGIDPNHKPKNDYEFYLHFSKLACRAATKEESDFIADEAKQFEAKLSKLEIEQARDELAKWLAMN